MKQAISPSRRDAPDLDELAPLLGTVRDVLRTAVSSFHAADLRFGQGTSNAYDDAVALVYWALHLPVDSPDTLLGARVSPREVTAALALIRERVGSRVPVAYLTGEAWLRGLRFRADRRALIPRSLIVEAMQDTLDEWRMETEHESIDDVAGWPARILDLCTGGGSIAIHAALRFPRASVVAVDIDADALALCAENVALFDLGERIELRQSNLLDDVAERFDLILCNPPYVPETGMATLPPEFLTEPTRALDGGPDGMALIERLLEQARERLTSNGLLLIEIGHEQATFEAAFPDLSFAYLPVTAGDCMIVAISREELPLAASVSAP